MDIDAVELAPHVLEDSIDRLLTSRDLELLLRMQELALAKVVMSSRTSSTPGSEAVNGGHPCVLQTDDGSEETR
jgi:hypothetical protein